MQRILQDIIKKSNTWNIRHLVGGWFEQRNQRTSVLHYKLTNLKVIKSQNKCNHIFVFPGSNGQDFPSKCHLERDACEHRRSELTVRYAGNCNPCQGFECDTAQQECHVKDLDLGRTPSCTCDRDCANETAPICASNGKTVRNINISVSSVVEV